MHNCNMVTLRMKYLIQGATFIVIIFVVIQNVILLCVGILIVAVLSAFMRHYDNTYKELIYDDFTYNNNKCYITKCLSLLLYVQSHL
jgi:hypothetical protein